MNELTARTFDKLVTIPPKPPKVLWGAQAIGDRLGVSADFVRHRLSIEAGSPIKKKAGRYCVIEDDLIAFFRE